MRWRYQRDAQQRLKHFFCTELCFKMVGRICLLLLSVATSHGMQFGCEPGTGLVIVDGACDSSEATASLTALDALIATCACTTPVTGD